MIYREPTISCVWKSGTLYHLVLDGYLRKIPGFASVSKYGSMSLGCKNVA